MSCNSRGPSLLNGRLGVRVEVDNHTIDNNLRREGWDVTERFLRGEGPVIVRQLARLAHKRKLSDLNYAHILIQRFSILKRWA